MCTWPYVGLRAVELPLNLTKNTTTNDFGKMKIVVVVIMGFNINLCALSLYILLETATLKLEGA